jgi:hypothetical protein
LDILESGWVRADGIIGDLFWRGFPRGEEMNESEVACAVARS